MLSAYFLGAPSYCCTPCLCPEKEARSCDCRGACFPVQMLTHHPTPPHSRSIWECKTSVTRDRRVADTGWSACDPLGYPSKAACLGTIAPKSNRRERACKPETSSRQPYRGELKLPVQRAAHLAPVAAGREYDRLSRPTRSVATSSACRRVCMVGPSCCPPSYSLVRHPRL